ncbi:MAG: hypothetical protein WC157_02430 [Candidatus Paceibacterota bacterium]
MMEIMVLQEGSLRDLPLSSTIENIDELVSSIETIIQRLPPVVDEAGNEYPRCIVVWTGLPQSELIAAAITAGVAGSISHDGIWLVHEGEISHKKMVEFLFSLTKIPRPPKKGLFNISLGDWEEDDVLEEILNIEKSEASGDTS